MGASVVYPTVDNRFNDTEEITLQKILQTTTGGGGTGGTGQIYTGAAPPAAPNNPNAAAVFYPTSGGTLYQWDIPSQTWV